MKSICVFCGAGDGLDEIHLEKARKTGSLIARNNFRLIYGGCSIGTMGAVADSALQGGAQVIGVIPEGLFGKELIHQNLTELREVPSMHERKKLMFDLADCFLALPGGIGTIDESIEILTWFQLGLHQKPLGLLNTQGYFNLLSAFLDKMVEDKFMPAATREYCQVDRDLDKLFTRVTRE